MQNKQAVDTNIYILNSIPTHFDRAAESYLRYKNGLLLNMSKEEEEQMNVLKVLDKLGFPMNQTGTYFYKEIIMKTIEELQTIETEEDKENLRSTMENSYSQFYFDIARNNIDIGLKSFHSCISIAYEDRKRTTDSIRLKQKIGMNKTDSDYRTEAILIAKYIMSSNNKRKNDQSVQTIAAVKLK